MTGEFRFIGLFFLICTILFGGCESFNIGKGKGPRVSEVSQTPSEKRKGELLNKIERKFEDADAHYELGQLYQSDGMWTQAEYHYNTAMSFDPVNRDAQAAMVKVLADSGETAKSEITAEIYMNSVWHFRSRVSTSMRWTAIVRRFILHPIRQR
jgi:lipoprotein NlpI